FSTDVREIRLPSDRVGDERDILAKQVYALAHNSGWTNVAAGLSACLAALEDQPPGAHIVLVSDLMPEGDPHGPLPWQRAGQLAVINEEIAPRLYAKQIRLD